MRRWCPVYRCRPSSFAATRPLVIGLTNDPERLIAVRRNRMNALQSDPTTPYVDLEAVRARSDPPLGACATSINGRSST